MQFTWLGARPRSQPKMDRGVRPPWAPSFRDLPHRPRGHGTMAERFERAPQTEIGRRESVGLAHAQGEIVGGPRTEPWQRDQR